MIATPKVSGNMKPLAIDLFCGLGGWTEGLLAEGYEVIGFDIERHEYGKDKYPAQLVLQDVLTLHGKQFKDAILIVASPPCQAYSYRAMPWKRAKALPPPDNSLFDACFRIQREACEAAGHHIPLIVENVRGAIPWVGRSRWNFGSFHLWGDVPALMPMTSRRGVAKIPGQNWSKFKETGEVSPHWNLQVNNQDGYKGIPHRPKGHWTNAAEHQDGGGGSKARKHASAMIAKIPFALSSHIARTFKPNSVTNCHIDLGHALA